MLGLRHDFSIWGTHCCHYTNGQWLKDVPSPACYQLRFRLGLEATFLLQFKSSFHLIAVYLLTFCLIYVLGEKPVCLTSSNLLLLSFKLFLKKSISFPKPLHVVLPCQGSPFGVLSALFFQLLICLPKLDGELLFVER